MNLLFVVIINYFHIVICQIVFAAFILYINIFDVWVQQLLIILLGSTIIVALDEILYTEGVINSFISPIVNQIISLLSS